MSRTLVRYTIPLDDSAQLTHRLGINSLAIDPSNSGTLYTAGRDGIVAAWDLQMRLSRAPHRFDDNRTEVQIDDIYGEAKYKRGLQAHTHWVNQIATSSDYQSVFSCSSDTSVKCWRPNAFASDRTETIGSHGDYVTSLAVPRDTNEWIATAGLDKTIILWDLGGKKERMRIDHKNKDGGMKQSIYSMTSGPNVLASGGIEKVIRVWDIRSGLRVTKFIGHTDNVRSLICSEDGKYFISASSDTTIKVWDVTAGRCLHTLTAHSEPVWTLMSDHPNLAVFHSADRSGLVLKTDLRPQSVNTEEHDSVAICKEPTGVHALAQIGGQLYTATSSSSINRWKDLETVASDPFADTSDAPLRRTNTSRSVASTQRADSPHHVVMAKGVQRSMKFTLEESTNGQSVSRTVHAPKNVRPVSLLSQASKISLSLADDNALAASLESLEPIRVQPESTIKGQAGLQAHAMLPDRRRVLTRDSDGFLKLWDITKCKQISDLGKIDMADAEAELQSASAVGSWCSINTRVGALTVEMDPRNLLDAETYFDDILPNEDLNFETRNQRFNLGKWMLQALFRGVIELEQQKDVRERTKLKHRRPGRLDLGSLSSATFRRDGELTPSERTPSFGSKNPYASALSTPGATFGLATPARIYNPKPNGSNHQSQGSLSSLGSSSDAMSSPTIPHDYFSSPHGTKDPDATPTTSDATQTYPNSEPVPKTPGGSILMKNMKWMRSNKSSKTSSSSVDPKKGLSTPTQSAPSSALPSPTPQKPEEVPNNYQELVSQRRKKFFESESKPNGVLQGSETWIQKLEPMPELVIPPNVGLSLAIFQPGEGEAKDIYRGTVGSIGNDLDAVSKSFPVWLAQILLLNEVPAQMQNIESNKHYFSFLPHPTSSLADPFNTLPGPLMRLGAARSLRFRKALTYISQRLLADLVQKEGQGRPEEEWLEILVGGKVVEPSWTLMMARRHLWKHGGDMKLEYKLKRE